MWQLQIVEYSCGSDVRLLEKAFLLHGHARDDRSVKTYVLVSLEIQLDDLVLLGDCESHGVQGLLVNEVHLLVEHGQGKELLIWDPRPSSRQGCRRQGPKLFSFYVGRTSAEGIY